MRILLLLMTLNFMLYADDLTIQITRDIDFKNGFGQIEAKPILKDANRDIKVLGEFNVEDKSGNVVMKIDKVVYEGKIYNLSEEFISKRRLKNPKKAQLKKQSKIKLNGGSHPEILAILNGETKVNSDTFKNNTSSQNKDKEIANSSYDSGSSYYRKNNDTSSNYPYYTFPNTNTSANSDANKDYSSSTTDENGNCKSPEIKDGMIYIYPLINGTCTQKTTTEANLFKKQNTSTCPNKISYNENLVNVGEEGYAIIDNTEYRVISCNYYNNIPLQKTTESCKVIPNYEDKTGIVQKQYWYILNNDRIDVGSCIPTEEVISIYDDDYNSCKYRYDFENNVAIKQTQWYYIYENKKTSLGECVDVSKDKISSMTYPMYESSQDCSCNILNGANICQTKLSFNGFNNTKNDATECRYINTEGVKIIDEFVGSYSFKDDSKQAIKKVNQYFIGIGGEKIYVAKDKETNIAFPYIQTSCGWEHDNDKKLSYHKSRIYIKDPELLNITLSSNLQDKVNGDEYEVKSCQAYTDIVLYWQMQLDLIKGKKTATHKRQVLIPENLSPTANKWTISTLDGNPFIEEYYIKDNTMQRQVPVFSSNYEAKNYLLDNSGEIYGKVKRAGNCQDSWSSYFPKYKTYYYNYSDLGLLDNPQTGGISIYYYVNPQGSGKSNSPLLEDNTEIEVNYSIELSNPITSYPTSVKMDENIVKSDDINAIPYKEETTQVCDTITTTDDKNNPVTKEECKNITTTIYSSGVKFEPIFDFSVINNTKYCKDGEEQSIEGVTGNNFILPEWDEKNQSYFEYIESIKKEALDTRNYVETINKINCKTKTTANINIAYVIGSIINRHTPFNLTQKEVQSLTNMKLNVTDERWCHKGTCKLFNLCDRNWVRVNKLLTSFETKKNWANNQTIYEYEMYRPFRRPDGTTFNLYERPGYFVIEQESDCKSCSK